MDRTPSDQPLIWKDRKRTLFGLPLSFTRYSLSAKKFMVSKGFLNIVEEEIMLYRVLDVRLTKKLMQRIFGIGSIEILSGDASTPKYLIKSVKKPAWVRDQISDLVDQERSRLRIKGRELYGIADSEMDIADSADAQT